MRYSSSPLVSNPASLLQELTCHMGSQCYLPPSTGDIPALITAKAGTQFSDPEGMQSSIDLGTAIRHSPCPRLHIAVATAINTTVLGEISTWVLSHRRQVC